MSGSVRVRPDRRPRFESIRPEPNARARAREPSACRYIPTPSRICNALATGWATSCDVAHFGAGPSCLACPTLLQLTLDAPRQTRMLPEEPPGRPGCDTPVMPSRAGRDTDTVDPSPTGMRPELRSGMLKPGPGSEPWRSHRPGPMSGSARGRTATSRRAVEMPAGANSIGTTIAGATDGTPTSSIACWRSLKSCR